MTSLNRLTAAIAMMICLLSLTVYAQSPDPELNHFATPGISFDYPAGYSVSDESTSEAQQFVITRKGSSVQLTLVVLWRLVLPNELTTATENLTDPLVNKVALTLGRANSPERTSIKTSVGPKQADGIRLQSSGHTKRTGEVIWLRLNYRLIAMAFVRSDVDEAVESQA